MSTNENLASELYRRWVQSRRQLSDLRASKRQLVKAQCDLAQQRRAACQSNHLGEPARSHFKVRFGELRYSLEGCTRA